MKRRNLAVFVLLFFSSAVCLWAGGGVLSHPRRMYLVQTEHFEILFPKESEETARFLVNNADQLYEKAKEAANYNHDFSMPVIISPDSDILKVTYTNSPYNRIVIFDSAGLAGSRAGSSATRFLTLQNQFYHEIFRALSCSVRSPLNHIIYKTVGGDGFQPVSLLNLPFSFVEAYANLSETAFETEENIEDYNDPYYQQLLIQAKLENKFPSWFQATSVRDIHPGNDLCYAAASGFAAYLMQTYGVEKYVEFWEECGKLHLLLLAGIFYKVYGKTIDAAWKDFKEAVPSPQDLDEMLAREKQTREIIEFDAQGLFEHIFYTNYGIVWYDGIRHEVDIFDFNSSIQLRQLLFLAEDIEHMALSPDGRYLSVSFFRAKHRNEFKEVVTHVYDIKKRCFLECKVNVRDGGFALDSNGKLCLAGVSVEKKEPVLKVYKLPCEEYDEEDWDDEDLELIYEKVFDGSEIPHSINPCGNGRLCYLLEKNGDQKLVAEVFSLADGAIAPSPKAWKLFNKNGSHILAGTFRYENTSKGPAYAFSFVPDTQGDLAHAAFIFLSKDFEPQSLSIQDCNLNGGAYYPVMAADKLFYCSRKLSHNELRFLPIWALPFTEGSILADQPPELAGELAGEGAVGQSLFDAKYNFLKYLLHVSVIPMLAIRDISFDDGAFLWPSLGLTLSSDSDPMRNTEFKLSAGADFLDLTLEKQINATEEEKRAQAQASLDKNKKYSLAGYIKNSSTPVDIEGGSMLNLSPKGEYDFKALAKTAWKIPVGTILRDMDFSISSIYTISTDYYDSNKSDVYPALAGWTPFDKAYRLFELDATAAYSNTHQYGISKYERRGFTFGARMYAMWDVNEMNLLYSYRNLTKQQILSGENTELTEAQLEALYTQKALDVSQINLGLFGMVEIPRLTPLAIHNGWVLSVPAVVTAELMNQTGTALEVKSELLLLGNEIQNGLPFLYLFFSRVGLKVGYDFCLDYDTTKVLLPDIRRENYLYDIFSQVYIKDSFYILLNSDFVIPVGNLSRIQFNMNTKAEFFPRTNGFKFSFNINASF